MIAKRRLLQIHRWCGLAICAFVLVQAITGGLLVFRDELAQVIDPAGMVRATTSGEAPLSSVVAAVRATYPGFELQRIVFPHADRATYFAHLVNAAGVVRYVSIDPGDGAVLRAGGVWRFPIEAILLIHYELMTDRLGLAIVLGLGLAILAMAVTGVAYWWPRPGRWRGSLQINWRMPGRVVLRQVHRAFGPLVLIVLAVSAATGIVLAAALLFGSGPVRSTAPTGLPPVGDANLDRALAMARAQFPGHGIRDLRMPAPGQFNVFFWAPERQPQAVHTVKIDLKSLRVTTVSPADADKSLSTFVLPIHTGESFGLIGKLVLLLEALALVTLAATGPLMWLQARPKGRRR